MAACGRADVVECEGARYLIESGMGVPRVMPRTIEMTGLGSVDGRDGKRGESALRDLC